MTGDSVRRVCQDANTKVARARASLIVVFVVLSQLMQCDQGVRHAPIRDIFLFAYGCKSKGRVLLRAIARAYNITTATISVIVREKHHQDLIGGKVSGSRGSCAEAMVCSPFKAREATLLSQPRAAGGSIL